MSLVPRQPSVRAQRHAFVGLGITTAAMGAGLIAVAAFDPSKPGSNFLRCPLHQLTGLWCPGCGMTRATHAMLHGHVVEALGFNLMFPLFASLLIGGMLTWVRAVQHRPAPRWPARAPAWSWLAIGAVLLAFTIVRNIPGAPFEALAP